MPKDTENPYVSRGGLKMRHALDTFELDVSGFVCADLGCSTGGFSDCLLQHGASAVTCVDTAYGQLEWKLRSDPRVTTIERTNALHAEPPAEGVDLVVIDLGWTPQRLAIPAAKRWLNTNGRIISLIKPHYELSDQIGKAAYEEIVLDDDKAKEITERAAAEIAKLGFTVDGLTPSPILGGGKRSKSKAKGNVEWLALLSQLS
jgi:23S rRNA (cytidine1920-2'-O)/16S rRNA (cytidine1409-2'-O)-methyltransferase